MAALTHFPKTRLSQLIGRLGGISREDAVEEAKKNLEAMREKADDVILTSIAALEGIVYAPAQGKAYSPEQMRDILALSDQIVTLAGTFGHTALDTATRSLCDVADGLVRAKRNDLASIHVHMGAIRMIAPGGAPLPPEHVDKMLSELAKILAHHGFDKLSDSAGDFEEPVAGAASA